LIVAGLMSAAGGFGVLLKQILIWRVSIKWYALALLGPLVLVLLATLLYIVAGGVNPAQWLTVPAANNIGGLIGPLIAGSVGEELGWRGFAQRLLQKRYNLLWASIIVGLLWATWHSWPLFAPGGTAHVDALVVLETYVRLIATAIIYGWMYVRTGGSILLVMLVHAGHNIAVDLISPTLLTTVTMPLLITCLYAVAAIALVVARPGHFFHQTKTR
ncbi:MAG TPA: CPBP family intramembrane glutamic endopeptidase, partial [Magnetospirillaceae bacterium]|nr:CPBP family intramembrane glutamic endopeptidase [Magnetospirillaceae bacterium]